MLLAKIWILINFVFYLGLGILTLMNPGYVADAVHFQLLTPGAIAEFKAMYGGLQIALAMIMFILYKNQNIQFALGFLALIYLGFGCGRMIGIITNHAFDKTTLIYISVEISSIIISSYLYANQK